MGLVALNTPEWRRDLALTACCSAAVAEADLTGDPGLRAARLIDCLGVIRSVHDAGSASAISMGVLRRALREGLAPLLPMIDGGISDHLGSAALLDGRGLLCDAVEDLGREHLVEQRALMAHWPWERLRAEEEEQRLYSEIKRLPLAEYARVRTLLATMPAAPQEELWETWGGLWGRFGFYEPVASWPWCSVSGWCFLCPECTWPMRAQPLGDGVVCVTCDAHVTEGARYTCRPRPSSSAPELEGGKRSREAIAFPAAADYLAVRRTVWRYFTLPAQMERAIVSNLPDAAGLDVTKYPDHDRYDLHITARFPLASRQWRVDAKAWRSLSALGRSLRDRPRLSGTDPLIIVVPHRQKAEMPVLQGLLGGRPDLQVMTDRQLTGDIRTWCSAGATC
ncbi:restriction endonuclease-related protein [Streptomyces chartreusis]|uniref:restriction endonuclease-related protein n=1 Tax=Streptomyces chartreusis TaxID=1969 RepID=UPI0038302B7D